MNRTPDSPMRSTTNVPRRADASTGAPDPSLARAATPYSRVRGGARYGQVSAARRRRRNIVRGVVLGLVAAVLLGAGIAAASAVSFYNSIGERLNSGVTEETKAVLAEQQSQAQELTSNWTDMSPFYMLLLGVDSDSNRMEGEESADYGADDSNYRTDTIILARVDPGNKKVTLVSIHRDTWLYFDGRERKINEAYSIGGIPETIQVVSEFAGVPITHYAQINLDGLYAIVDVLGGVEVDVAYAVNDEYTGWTLDAGTQVLDGENAEVFVRSRHGYDYLGDGDRYRAANQRVFIAAVMRQLLSASPAQMVASIDTLANYVNTDLTLDQIVNLALAMRGLDTDTDVYSTMNPTVATYTNNTWYEISDDDYWQQIMAQVDAGEKPDVDYAYVSASDDINNPDHGTADASTTPSSVNVSIKNASGDDERGTSVEQTIQANGWTVASISEANITLDSTVVVYDSSTYKLSAETIASQIGGTVEEAGDTWTMEGDVMVVVGSA